VKRTLPIIAAFFILIFITIYLFLSSPRFLLFAIKKLNQSIPGRIVFDSMKLDLEARRFTAKNLRYETDQGQVAVRVKSLDLGFAMTHLLRGHFEVQELKAKEVQIFIPNFPKAPQTSRSWRTITRLILRRLSIKQSQLDHAQIQISEGQQIQLHEITLRLKPRDLQREELQLSIGQVIVELKEKSFQASEFKFFGEVEIPILRDYAFFVEEAAGELQIGKLSLPQLPQASLQGRLEVDGDELFLHETALEFFEGKRARAKYSKIRNPQSAIQGKLLFNLALAPKIPQLKLHLRTPQPISTQVLPDTSKYLRQTFSALELDFKTELQGNSLKNLNGQLDGVVKILGNRDHDQTPDYTIKIKGTIKKGALALKTLNIKSNEMELKLGGSIDFAGQRFNTKISGKNFHVGTLINALTDLELSALAHVEGSIVGPFLNPTLKVQVSSPRSRFMFLNFGEHQGAFKIENGDLFYEAQLSGEQGRSGDVQVKVQDIFLSKRRVSLKTNFKNIDGSDLLKNPEIKAKLSGDFTLEVTPATGKKLGELRARLSQVVVYNFHFAEVHALGKLKGNRFVLDPIKFTPQNYESLNTVKPTVFQFDDRGWTVTGELLPGFKVEGKFSKKQPDRVVVNGTLQNLELRPVLASLLIPPQMSFADAKVKLVIGLGKTPSAIDLDFSRFVLPLEERAIQNNGPLQVRIRPPKINFQRVQLVSRPLSPAEQTELQSAEEKTPRLFPNQETALADTQPLILSGDYTLAGPINLKLKGHVDLGLLTLLPQYFREAEGFAPLELNITGTLKQPLLRGILRFEDNLVTLRPLRAEIENLSGEVHFSRNSLLFKKLTGNTRDGDFNLDGRIELKDYAPTYYDFSLRAREVAVSKPNNYRLIFSGDLKLKGPADNPLLSGEVSINEGVYIRDFAITQGLLKPEITPFPEKLSKLTQNITLDLKIKSPGELAIKNNVAEMYFSSDLTLTGDVENPKISGALEVLDGKFEYFTVSFAGAQGVIDFRDPKKGPYVDVTVQKEFEISFDTINVTAHIQGFANNLQLEFASIPPLNRRDLIALVLTGVPPGDARSLTGPNLATSLLAAQLSQVLQKPLRKASIDIFRLEASDPDQPSLTTLVVGKKLTERLTLEVKTDLGVDEPVQGVQMEYLLLDNVLVQASQLTTAEFSFNLALRFRLN